MMLFVDFSLFIKEGSRWIQVLEYSVFAYACYRLWKQTSTLSTGHSYIGQLAILCLFADLLIMLFAPERLTLFRTIQYVPLTVWLLFNDSYFRRYPLPNRTIDQAASDPLDDAEIKSLINHLYEKSTRESFFLSRQFQHMAIWAIVLLSLLWGFSRTISAYEWGFVAAAKERADAKQETKQAVITAVKSATIAVAKEVAPIKKQGLIDSATLKAALRNQGLLETLSKPKAVKRKTGPVKLQQNVQKIQPRPIKPLTSVDFELPRQSQLQPPERPQLASHQ